MEASGNLVVPDQGTIPPEFSGLDFLPAIVKLCHALAASASACRGSTHTPT